MIFSANVRILSKLGIIKIVRDRTERTHKVLILNSIYFLFKKIVNKSDCNERVGCFWLSPIRTMKGWDEGESCESMERLEKWWFYLPGKVKLCAKARPQSHRVVGQMLISRLRSHASYPNSEETSRSRETGNLSLVSLGNPKNDSFVACRRHTDAFLQPPPPNQQSSSHKELPCLISPIFTFGQTI